MDVQGFDVEPPLSLSDVVWMVGYKGKDFPERAFADAISNNKYMMGLCDEVVRTASSSIRLQSQKEKVKASRPACPFERHFWFTS